jgi:hypothetical protein
MPNDFGFFYLGVDSTLLARAECGTMKAGFCLVLFLCFFPVMAGLSYGGSISGAVRLKDAARGAKVIKVSKDQDYCGVTLPDETYLVGLDGRLKNVVVFVEGVTAVETPLPTERLLENHGCLFAPRVLAMRLGEKLILRNRDPKLHIVHSYLHQRTVFNASLPFRDTKLDMTSKIRAPGLLKFACDTHAWMRGYIYVFDHPFYATTDERGEFLIPNLPPGRYVVKAWHEEAGIRTREITVPEDGYTGIDFEF